EMADRETTRRSGARQADEVFASDVRSKKARANGEPANVAAGEEVIGAHVLLGSCRPVADPEQHEEVAANDGQVENVEIAHGPFRARGSEGTRRTCTDWSLRATTMSWQPPGK